MVRKKTILSPLYSIALVALSFFYLFSSNLFIENKGLLFSLFSLIISICVLCLFFTFICLPIKYKYNKAINVGICICTGIILGSIGTINWFSSVAPMVTLSTESKITCINGTLKSDPQAWGSSWYRVRVTLQEVEESSGAQYSATGNCVVLLPFDQVRSALPGGISTKNGYRQYVSKGLPIRVSGIFSREDSTLFIGQQLLEAKRLEASHFISSARASLRLSLIKLLYDWKESGAFLLALLSGNRDYLSPVLSESFRYAGLSHILALSGMHLSLMGMVAIKTGKKIGGKNFGIKLSLGAMCFFVWFAGSSPSLNRALIMALLAIMLQLFGIPASVLPVLAATSIIQTVFIPHDVKSLAFILSCSALWGIIVFGDALSHVYTKKVPENLFSGFSASVGAQLMTAPIVAFTFKILCPIGILASWCISPLASIFLIFGMICVFISLIIPQLNGICGMFLDFLYHCIAIPTSFFSQIPPLSFHTLISTLCAAFIPLITGIALTIFSLRYNKRRTPDDSFARL